MSLRSCSLHTSNKDKLVSYLPFAERTIDTQYRDRLRLILEQGEVVETQQGVKALTYIAPPPMRFKLENGVPLITERKIPFWRAAIGEILAFANGVTTQVGLEEYGCKWWDKWLTKEKCVKRGLSTGDNGPGSYGGAFHDFPTAEGTPFDQFKHLIEQIKELPDLRTHFISPWIPQYIGRGKGKRQQVVVAPCHGWIHVRILPGRRLVLHMFQRSADFPVGVPANMIQYGGGLANALAFATDNIPYMFVHSFSDAHIYVDQVEAVKEMLSREPRKFPLLVMNPRSNFFDVRPGDFNISDYNPHPAIANIPVAI